VKTCTYQVCKLVPEHRVKQVTYRVCRLVPEKCVKQVPYWVCKPVQVTKTIHCVRYVPKQVAYTVTRCVPRVVCTQVPVTVCCPLLRCCLPGCCEPCGEPAKAEEAPATQQPTPAPTNGQQKQATA
ncbi:MAG: hypothetical protein NZ899_06220, partial [Thermoguttaceae bacterium]|nr:hypothetical protein [Thermoguttaceae bacterium]